MKSIEVIVIKPENSGPIALTTDLMNFDMCEKLDKFVIYCSQYGRWKCPYKCDYAEKQLLNEKKE